MAGSQARMQAQLAEVQRQRDLAQSERGQEQVQRLAAEQRTQSAEMQRDAVRARLDRLRSSQDRTIEALNELVAGLHLGEPEVASSATTLDGRQEVLRYCYGLLTPAGEPPADTVAANLWRLAGDLERSLAHPDRADRAYQQAIALGQQLCQRPAAAPKDRARLAAVLEARADLHRKDRPAEAESLYRQAIDRQLALARESRGEVPQSAAARALGKLSTLLAEGGRLEEGEEAGRQAADLLHGLAAARPERFDLPLAERLTELGEVQRKRNSLKEALETTRAAVALWRKLASGPSAPEVGRQGLGGALNQLGLCLLAESPVDAESAFKEAEQVFRSVLAQRPQSASAHSDLAQALHQLAGLHAGRSQLDQTCRLLQEAATHELAALEIHPADIVSRRALRNHWSWLAEAQLRKRDHSGAYETALRLAQVFPQRWQDGYEAACVLVRCAGLAQGADPGAAEKYSAGAVNLLRQALRSAPPGQIRSADTALAPLRARADFKALLDHATGAAPPARGTVPAQNTGG